MRSLGCSGQARTRAVGAGAQVHVRGPYAGLSRFAGLAAVFGALVLCGCDGPAARSNAKETPPALTVATVPASTQAIRHNVIATGSVVAWQELSIPAEVSQLRVVAVPVDEGDQVKRGQLLAEIDSTIVAAQVRQAEAQVREAQSNLVQARNDASRARDLAKQGNMSPQAVEDRVTKAESAEARLALAEASRDELRARLAMTRILAPADGYISKRSVLIGDVVVAGKELFRMVRDGRLELDAQVPEADFAAIAVGQRARIAREGVAPIEATVRLSAPVVDPKTRLGVVHIALPPDSPLKAGMFARAEIFTAQAVSVAVPEAALVWRDARPSVFVLGGDNRVALRVIETGARQDGWVEVTKGLNAGEPVVNIGAGFLHDGDKVALQTADAETLKK